MKKIYLISLLFMFSCQDFLRETSQNLSYIESIEDLDELLLGSGYIGQALLSRADNQNHLFTECTMEEPILAHFTVMDDDSQEHLRAYGPFGGGQDVTFELLAGYHRWEKNPHETLRKREINEQDFHNFYKRIAILNAILAGSEELQQKRVDLVELDRVRAETYFLRAWNYFMLVNIYGTPYDKNNPEDPYGVPLKLDEAVLDIYYSRNTVGQVYRQIRDDLLTSIELYEKNNITQKQTKRASLNSSLALLSRVYLYMEEYENVISTVEKIKGYNLFNFENFSDEMSFGTHMNTETIFSHGSYTMQRIHTYDFFYYKNTDTGIEILTEMCNGYIVSDELTKMYDENDNRLQVFFTKGFFDENLRCRKYKIFNIIPERNPVTGDYFYPLSMENPTSSYAWLRYSEILLNKAEAEACLGRSEAVGTIRRLLSTRYKVLPTIPSGGEELVKFIRDERRKELCFEGHRLFDLKRYAVNSVYPFKTKITHKRFVRELTQGYYVGKEDGYMVLDEYNENSRGSWLVPITQDVIDYCKGNLVNLERNGSKYFRNN